MTRLSDIGELGLIARIERMVGQTGAVTGIGDDAAVIDQGTGTYLLATVDMLVEDVHFRRSSPPEDVGARALAVNLSDIAAMGGTARHALTSIALPETLSVEYVEALYRGLLETARAYDVGLVGGNVAGTSGPVVIDVTVLGDVPADQVVRRTGAREGDLLVVSGVLGQAAGERMLWDAGRVDRIPPPTPRLRAGRALAESGVVHAMMDISDGLGSDIHHLANASGVGTVISAENVPIGIAGREAAGMRGEPPLDVALFGGEDYELLLALAAEDLETARQAVGDVPLAVVGTVLHPDQGVLIERYGGAREPLPAGGWRHF